MAKTIREQVHSKLYAQFGIRVIEVGFTSICDPFGEAGEFTKLRTTRAQKQVLVENVDLHEMELAELDSSEKIANRKRKLFEESVKARIKAITSSIEGTDNLAYLKEATLLSELFGPEMSFRMLAVREAARRYSTDSASCDEFRRLIEHGS